MESDTDTYGKATINEILMPIGKDGKSYKPNKANRTYKIIPYQTEEYTNANGETVEYKTFSIKDSNKKTIGTVTQHTTMARLDSLILRYENPCHMESFDLIANIGHIGSSLYVVVPKAYVDWCNILVDDSIDIEIIRKDGKSYKGQDYKISLNKSTYVINLNDIRRLSVVGDDLRLLSVKDFKKSNESDLFLSTKDVVRIFVKPNPEKQRFAFADSMRKEIQRKKAKQKQDD